jgi:hypothetical protein
VTATIAVVATTTGAEARPTQSSHRVLLKVIGIVRHRASADPAACASFASRLPPAADPFTTVSGRGGGVGGGRRGGWG